MQFRLTFGFFYFMFPKNLHLVLQMPPLLLLWISKNICKNTKHCKLTCFKNKELFSLILQKILRTLKTCNVINLRILTEFHWFLKRKKCNDDQQETRFWTMIVKKSFHKGARGGEQNKKRKCPKGSHRIKKCPKLD